MNNKDILANAPKGVNTHMLYDGDSLYKNLTSAPRSLADIKRIVELEEEVKRLQVSELEQQAKGIKDAVESASKAYEGKHLGWHAQAALICNLISCFAEKLRQQAKR
jgi:hypothetical protein